MFERTVRGLVPTLLVLAEFVDCILLSLSHLLSPQIRPSRRFHQSHC